MADRYVRDDLGRFAPTGRAKLTATGRRGGPRGGGARARSVNGTPVLEFRKANVTQKGKINSTGVVAVGRSGLKAGPKGTVKPTNVNSVVLKMKKTGYSKNGPSVRSAVRASGARGVQVAANARYVSRTEARGVPGGNIVSRTGASRSGSRQRPPRSGYLVINSLG
jgi:hypothetical protein